jgi:hypothetical protein
MIQLSTPMVGASFRRHLERSATIFFSLLFSSSSCFSRRISVGKQPVELLLPIEVGCLADPSLSAREDASGRHPPKAVKPVRKRKLVDAVSDHLLQYALLTH